VKETIPRRKGLPGQAYMVLLVAGLFFLPFLFFFFFKKENQERKRKRPAVGKQGEPCPRPPLFSTFGSLSNPFCFV